MKNIRNNLLNGKKFVFPEFIYNDGLNVDINFPAGFIQWKYLYNIYDRQRIVNQFNLVHSQILWIMDVLMNNLAEIFLIHWLI